jgi:ATP-dependent RNA helicase DeaD
MTQIRQVATGAQIIVATPGRMLDMLKRKKVNVSAIRWLVLDEADEMLNMGFKEELTAVLASTPEDKRVLLFSATMPRGIESIARSYMKKPHEITVGSRNTTAETSTINIMWRTPKTDMSRSRELPIIILIFTRSFFAAQK